jgi:hypothetical protein
MSRLAITFPELLLLAGTRALGGVGVGLLLAGRLTQRQQRNVGLALFAVGALSTIPLAGRILPRVRRRRVSASELLRMKEADVS